MVCLVQNKGLKGAKLKLTSFLKVFNSPWGPNDHFDSLLQRPYLGVDVALAINTLDSELTRAGSESFEFIRDLNGQLPSGDQNQNQRLLPSSILKEILSSKSLQGGKGKGEGLPASSPVLGKNILPLENEGIGFLLNWKEIADPGCPESLLLSL